MSSDGRGGRGKPRRPRPNGQHRRGPKGSDEALPPRRFAGGAAADRGRDHRRARGGARCRCARWRGGPRSATARPPTTSGTRRAWSRRSPPRGSTRWWRAIEQLPAHRDARSGPEELAGTGKGYVRFALAHPAHFSIMFDSAELDGDDPAFREASNRAYGLLTRAIERCVREGRLRPDQVGPATVASWSLVHGFASLWIGRSAGPPQRGGIRRCGAGPGRRGDRPVRGPSGGYDVICPAQSCLWSRTACRSCRPTCSRASTN